MNHEICLIGSDVLLAQCEKKFLNDLGKFSLIRETEIKLCQDTKKLLLHHLLYELFELLVGHATPSNKSYVLLVKSVDILGSSSELKRYSNCTELSIFLNKIFAQLKTHLPIYVEFVPDLAVYGNKESGEYKTMLAHLKHFESKKPARKNLRNLKKVSRKYNLKYLEKEYFGDWKKVRRIFESIV